MKTRCKMRLTSVTDFGNGNGGAKFACEYDEPLSKEDTAFSKYTPAGEAEFSINNQTVLDQLEPGKSYYFDISEVPPAPAN